MFAELQQRLNARAARPRSPRLLRTEGVWVALALLLLFGALRYDTFLTEYNILSSLSYMSMFVLISLGMCFVIMSGGIDLSVGSVAALSSVVAAHMSESGLVVALPAGVAVGALVGAINAFVITRMRIAPFIATLAMMLAARGTALILADNQSVSVSWTSDFTKLGLTKLEFGTVFGLFDHAVGLQWPIVITFAVIVWCWFLLERFPFGRHVLSIGGNPDAAELMGLRTTWVLARIYVLSGTLAGLAGVFLASGFGAGQPLEGLGWELSAIAGVVVGGTLLTGGLGSVTATVAGALLLGFIFNILNFENGRGVISLSAYWQSVIRGAFLFLVVILQSRLTRTRNV